MRCHIWLTCTSVVSESFWLGDGGVVGASAACLVRWRRMSCSGLALHVGLPALLVRPTDMGLSLHSPSRHLICRGWDARDRLPV